MSSFREVDHKMPVGKEAFLTLIKKGKNYSSTVINLERKTFERYDTEWRWVSVLERMEEAIEIEEEKGKQLK